MYQLYKSRKTILEMLVDRGYEQVISKQMSEDKFIKWASEISDNINVIKKEMEMVVEDSKGEILVHWQIPPKLGSQEITNLVSYMRELDITRAIVIIEGSITPHAKGTIKTLRQEATLIDVFTIRDTQFNISKHVLVPCHQICSSGEKSRLMKTYSVNRKQLPNICFNDPMVRYLGAQKGELIKITRDSDTMKGEKTISYRLVI